MAIDWFIELQGDSFDLERLAAAFSDPPVTIRKEGDRYRLRDQSLTDSEAYEYVRAELHQTLRRINALARLQSGNDHDEVQAGAVGHPTATGGGSPGTAPQRSSRG